MVALIFNQISFVILLFGFFSPIQAQSHQVHRVFENRIEDFMQFQNAFEAGGKTSEEAIRTWLIQLGFTPQLTVQSWLDAGGAANHGIFLLQTPAKDYVLKVTLRTPGGSSKEFCPGLHRLWEIQEKGFNHLAREPHIHKSSLPNVASVTLTAYTDKYCLAVLEKAPGISLKQLRHRNLLGEISHQQLLAIYQDLGAKQARMHIDFAQQTDVEWRGLTTWVHRDANAGNVFYDLSTQTMTYIDLDSGAFGQFDFQGVARNLQKLILFSNSAPPPRVPNILKAFISGYLSELPLHLKDEALKTFYELCSQTESIILNQLAIENLEVPEYKNELRQCAEGRLWSEKPSTEAIDVYSLN